MNWLTEFEPFVRRQEPLLLHTWFRVGGPAEYFAEPASIPDLRRLVVRCQQEAVPVRLLGGGSNVLVSDQGVRGMVVRLPESFAAIEIRGDHVLAGGAAKLGHVISAAVRAGLGGLEPLVGIPGTVGGALHANAGSRSGDVGQWTDRATVMTIKGEIIEHGRQDLSFNYRQSSLDELAILSAEFALEEDNPQELTKRMQRDWILRKASQPLGHQSTGCIFKNPRGMSAGMLIDQADLKGTRVGGAEVSQRHANFIVADPEATSRDILELIELVRSRVAERLGVELETGIEIWR